MLLLHSIMTLNVAYNKPVLIDFDQNGRHSLASIFGTNHPIPYFQSNAVLLDPNKHLKQSKKLWNAPVTLIFDTQCGV